MAYLHTYAQNARKGIPGELERPHFIERFCSSVTHKPAIEHVEAEMFFPIVIDPSIQAEGKGLWNGNFWKSHQDGSDLAWAVKLGILLAEDRELGIPAFESNRHSNPSGYRNAIYLYALDQISFLSTKEKAKLHREMMVTSNIDWQVYNDIEQVKFSLSRKKGNKKNELDVNELFGDGQPNAQRHPLLQRVCALRQALLQNPVSGAVFGGNPIPGIAGANENDALVQNARPEGYRQRNDAQDPVLPEAAADEEEMGEEEEAEEDGMMLDDNAALAGADEGNNEQYVPVDRKDTFKIHTTLTAIPTSDARTGYESKRLYMLRITIADPTINLSLWMVRLSQYCKRQNAFLSDAMNGGGGGGGGRRPQFNFRFKHHNREADTDHPAFNFCQERYLKCAAYFARDGHMRTDKMIKFEGMLHKRDSKIHPEVVFSFENASSILIEHGADPSFAADKTQWINRDANSKMAIFPEGTATFEYPPETVFWCHNNNIGLMEQLFPQRNSQSLLYSALLDGKNVEETLSLAQKRKMEIYRVTATAKTAKEAALVLRRKGLENAEQELGSDDALRASAAESSDGLSDAERDAVNKRVMKRIEIQGARTIDYQTGNRMVHQAYEAEAVYKTLAHLFPDNGPDIYRRVQPYVKKYKNYWIGKLNANDSAALYAAIEESGTKADCMETGWAEFIPNQEQRSRIVSTFHLHRGYWRSEVARKDHELFNEVKGYEAYCFALAIVQEGCMERFSQMFRLDGRVDNLPISDPIKAVCKWFNKSVGKSRIITRSRPFLKKDPNLTFFATDMTKLMTIYSRVARVVQPKVPLIAEGLQSCYDWMPGQINFHILMHGRFDLGKTYQLLTILLNFSSIPGRVREESRSTFAAKDTGAHFYDSTLAMDECPNWMTSAKAQEKNAESVNQMKQRMTNKRSHLLSFERKTMPDGSTRRDTERYVTDDTSTMACVTNNVVEKTAALSSRFFTMVMKDVGVSVLEKHFKINAGLKENSKEYIRLHEFCTAASKKAAQCGAILRDINMTLWDDVTKRMIQFLEENKIIPKDSGYRPVQIMIPVLRQYVYHRAFLLTWHAPGAPHFNEAFTLQHLRTMQRFLYVDLQTIIFVWTLLGSQYVDGNNSTVLEAAVKSAGVQHWGEGSSMYDVYINRKDTKINFRRLHNANYEAPKDGGVEDVNTHQQQISNNGASDKYLLDLNYLTIEDTSFYNCCEQIAARTPANNKIAANDIKGILEVLSERHLPPPHNGYAMVAEGSFNAKHGKHYRREDDTWRKNEYENPNAAPGEPLTFVYEERDVQPIKPHNQKVQLAAVIIEKPRRINGKHRVHIAPWAIQHFQEEVIERAFRYVVITPYVPRKKFITGRTHPCDPSVFMCMDFTDEEFIQQYIDIVSREEKRPVGFTRRDGTVFARNEYNTQAELIVLSEQLDGVDFKRCDKPYELVTDLEYYSALDQHICAGRPLDMPVECPKFIDQRYEKACALMNVETHKRDYVYPITHVCQQKKKRRNTQVVVSSDVTKFNQDSLNAMTALERSIDNSCNGLDEYEIRVQEDETLYIGGGEKRNRAILNEDDAMDGFDASLMMDIGLEQEQEQDEVALTSDKGKGEEFATGVDYEITSSPQTKRPRRMSSLSSNKQPQKTPIRSQKDTLLESLNDFQPF